MPDPNEIAAAAERVRLIRAGEPLENFYDDPPWDAAEDVEAWREFRLREDHRILVDYALAHLAEHADEPVTREWLVGVLGFAGETDVEGDCRWRETMYADCRIVYYAEGDEYVGYLCNDEPEFADANVVLETRGDVLAFLRLVRWPVKGGSDE